MGTIQIEDDGRAEELADYVVSGEGTDDVVEAELMLVEEEPVDLRELVVQTVLGELWSPVSDPLDGPEFYVNTTPVRETSTEGYEAKLAQLKMELATVETKAEQLAQINSERQAAYAAAIEELVSTLKRIVTDEAEVFATYQRRLKSMKQAKARSIEVLKLEHGRVRQIPVAWLIGPDLMWCPCCDQLHKVHEGALGIRFVPCRVGRGQMAQMVYAKAAPDDLMWSRREDRNRCTALMRDGRRCFNQKRKKGDVCARHFRDGVSHGTASPFQMPREWVALADLVVEPEYVEIEIEPFDDLVFNPATVIASSSNPFNDNAPQGQEEGK